MTDGLRPGIGGQRFRLLRRPGGSTAVTPLELFFDLVYVFAVGQISHQLLGHLDWRGALEASIIVLAIWWAWIDTTWITNWFDPEKLGVRLMLITLMLLSLTMSAAIPEAFGDRGLWFAIAYVTIQIGRSAFCLVALGRNEQRSNFARILFWSVLSMPLWIAGGLAEGDTRLNLWIAAVGFDCVAPALGYVTPRLGKSITTDWEISGEHLAERCQLFMIICLGETVLLTGATLAAETVTTAVAIAYGASFLMSVMMWWIYFSRSGEAGELFENAASPGGLGRAYSYFHIPMVAGIISLAVAHELAIAHPTGSSETSFVAVTLGGALLYMLGNAAFNVTLAGGVPVRRGTAILILIALIPIGTMISPVALLCAVLAIFIALAIWDYFAEPPSRTATTGESLAS